MKQTFIGQVITAIDIGTTKICVLIARVESQGNLEIVGVGQHPSYGLKKGVVVSIPKTVESIKAAVAQAQQIAGITIDAATVGISGGHIKSYNSMGVVAIRGKDVTQYDVNRVVDAAKAIPLPPDQEILHVLPQYFRVDGREYVVDSIGMYGVRLDAQVHIITGAVSSAQNIINSCERSGISVNDIVLEQLASGEAVLTPSERQVGAGIIDIGGGTSDFAVYKDGRIRHTKVLPIAGTHFTNDLAIGLSIPLSKAEELKKRYGINSSGLLEEGRQTILVDLDFQDEAREVKVDLLAEILRARAEEIFEMFSDEMDEYRLRKFMPSGIVLTGGGSLLQGIKQIAEQKLDMSVRIGYPLSRIEGSDQALPDILKSPIYSTAYGLLLYATGQREHVPIQRADDSAFSRVVRRMRSWIYDFL